MSTETNYLSYNPEIWGGIECTINRVQNTFRDQLADADHYTRKGDLAQLCGAGIRKIRYPILWEKHLPAKSGKINWSWISASLAYLRSKNVAPVAGLLHHGSGPLHTNLLDAAFPGQLAAYAGQVAAQFPWLEYYTPVNEPLTTARFSGLYGYWYPHHSNERSFFQMVFNQVKAIILSMREIRKVNPAARLVQTEDLCKIHSTPLLAYQANFENERRWLTYDLLCGRFNPQHALWHYCVSLGIPLNELMFFAENNCPPDIMGFNYYITSERWLDENLNNYPPQFHGGNGRHQYADTDAARAHKRIGLAALLEEAWQRYQLPMAITECHLHCTREEQMRWLKEIYDDCLAVCRKGVAIKAITIWSMLGSYDWDSLLLQNKRNYEPGVFDTSSGYLRPTLLAAMVKSLATNGVFEHALLKTKGWWHRTGSTRVNNCFGPPLLIISEEEDTAQGLQEICMQRGLVYNTGTAKQLCTITMATGHGALAELLPWGVIMNVNDRAQLTVINNVLKTCRHKQIPVLLLAQADPGIFNLIHETGPALMVQNNGVQQGRYINEAIDLFIDGETGIWYAGVEGVTKKDSAFASLVS